MSANRNSNNSDNEDNDIIDSLRDNIGRVITIFTQSGGCSGRGFTGLLVNVDCHTIRLVTALPSAPRNPFGISQFNDFGFNSRGRCHRTRFGTSIIIPINKIVSFVFNDQ
jgi:hypothetical protein